MRRSVALVVAALSVVAACSRGPDAVPASRREASAPSPARTAAATPTPTGTPGATSAPAATPTSGPGQIDVERLRAHVHALAVEIGPRMAGTEGDERAAEWIGARMAEQGLVVHRQEFALPQGGVSWNVIGRPEGVDLAADRYLVVGGHYDSLNGPGANDNATGIAVALDVARAVSEVPAPLPVVVVAFGAEERQPTPQRHNHVGSRHFVDRMTGAERGNLVAFVNVDMVGWGDRITLGRLDRGPREATERLQRLADELGIPARVRVTPDWSDNGPFLKAGMNAGWLWTGEDPVYHTPRDTFDHIQWRAVSWAGRLALAAVRSYT